MSLRIITAPAAEPVEVADVLRFHRIDTAVEDADIERAILGARDEVENWTRRRLITQTLEQLLDRFPRVIELDVLPVQSVVSVKYLDVDGAEQTVDPSVYTVDIDSTPARIFPAYSKVWLSTRAVPNAVTVRFVAGYGDEAESVPAVLRSAMQLLIGDTYEYREATITGTTARELPRAVSTLMSPYVWTY